MFFSLSGMKLQKMNTQGSQERKFEEKVRKKGEQFYNIYEVDLHFCFNQHQNLLVKVKLNVFIFFFRLKSFSSRLCSTHSSPSFSSRHKSNHWRCSIEKAVLKNSQHSLENTCVRVTFNKIAGLKVYIKNRVQQREFSCEYWGILKKTHFEEHLGTTASLDNFKTFHLQCFHFMSNTVRICIILIITLSVKIKIKICLLGQS